MNSDEKLQLIDQLSLRLRWLIQALSKAGYHEGLGTISIVYVDIDKSQLSVGDWGIVDAQQAAGIVSLLEPLYDKEALAELMVDYDFTIEGLSLTVSDRKYRDVEGGAPSSILDYVDEARIREAFANHEAKFFQETNTTPLDWRIDC